MFVIELTYEAGLAAIDANMAAHVKFLKKYYEAGNFLVSGRKIPRDGGIIIAVGKDREAIEAIIREDPFVTRKLASYRTSSSATASTRATSRRASKGQATSLRRGAADRLRATDHCLPSNGHVSWQSLPSA